MAKIDAGAIAQQVRMLGLITDAQLKECMDDTEHRIGNDAESLILGLERKGFLTPWQSGKIRKGDKGGYFIGGYRLQYKIGYGTFGRVYRAEDPKTKGVVAMKILKQRWSQDTHCVDLFTREGRVGLAMRHPNIVQVLAVDQDPTTKQYYLVMEFVEGGSLREFLAIRKTLGVNEALRLLDDAAQGLAYAHGKGVTHRDMKPTNMLISSQGTIKLVDFGLAGISAAQDLDSEDAKVDRTVDYAGLERSTGVKSGDPRSDIFFLGCTFYQMLVNRSPLQDAGAERRLIKQRFGGIVPLTAEEVKGAPPQLFELLNGMLAFDPMQRYQTAAKLAEAVRNVRAVVEGKAVETSASSHCLFLVEPNEKLQGIIRAKFKELGFKVLVSSDPSRALHFSEQQAFDAIIMDVGSTGEDGLLKFRQIMGEAEVNKRACVGVLLLSEEQASWAERINRNPRIGILVRPITLRQLIVMVHELLKKAVPPA